MRITNGMVAANTLRNINKAANRLADANAAVASNKKIQLASDDPVVAARTVTYRSYVSQIKQYQDNADAADGWQTATDDALSSLYKIIQSVQELTNQAASDTCSDSDREGIATSISTLRDEAITAMNSTYAGRYIFGGYSTSEAPYAVETTDIGDTVTFKDNYLSLCGVVSSDIDDADILTFYKANTSNVSDSTATLSSAAAIAKSDVELFTSAGSTYGVAKTLKEAEVLAKTTYNAAAQAAEDDPTNTTLADAATTAKTMYDSLTTAVTNYGGTTTLSAAEAKATTISTALTGIITSVTAADTVATALTTAVTSYGSGTDLTTATASALTDYNTAVTNLAADPTSATLIAAKEAAETMYNSLNTATTNYGGSTTVTAAATLAQTAADTLATSYSAAGTLASIKTNISDMASTLEKLETNTSYGSSMTLTVAATLAKAAYDTAAANLAADPTSTTLTSTAADAKTLSNTLAAAVSMYGGNATILSAATDAATTVATLEVATSTYDKDQEIKYNVGFTSDVTVNIEGQDVTGEGSTNLFDTFAKLLLALNGDTTYKSVEVDELNTATVTTNTLDLTSLLDEFTTDLARLTVTQATLGARMDNVANVQDSLGDAYTSYNTIMSDNENIDTAEAATELTSAEYTYEAVLAVGAKVISKSLIDYIA